MPKDEMARIRDKVQAARSRLLAAVEGLAPAAWEWRPEDGRWSIRLVLAHVGSAQWSHLAVARRLLAGQPVDLPGFDLDTWNEAQVAERADWPVSRVLADLEAAHQATLVLLEELDEEMLATRGEHPALGEVSVGQILRIVALHDGLHRRDVLSVLREKESAG